MYPDELFSQLEDGDEEEMVERLSEYFCVQDAANQDRVVDLQMCNEYIRAMEQFRIFLDPYGVTYKVPTITDDVDKNIENIRNFFQGVKSGDSLYHQKKP